MSAPLAIPVRFADKYRLWQEFILASERNGRVFVPTDVREVAGTRVLLEVSVGDDEELIPLWATVDARRPPSMRFSRGLFLRLADSELETLRARLGVFPGADLTAGRLRRRYAVRWPVAFRTPALLRPVQTEDISAEGMHIEMPERVRKGHILELTLTTPQGHELLLAATVMWTSETSRRVGLRFLFDDDDTAAVFRGMLDHAVLLEGVLPATENRERPTVLVADKDAALLSLVEGTLGHGPYRVLQAHSGEEALSLIRSERPDLVVLEVRSPEIDGVRVCRAVRADAELAELVVVFVGKLDERDLGEMAEEAGASDWLVKPVQPPALLKIVQTYVAG